MFVHSWINVKRFMANRCVLSMILQLSIPHIPDPYKSISAIWLSHIFLNMSNVALGSCVKALSTFIYAVLALVVRFFCIQL